MRESHNATISEVRRDSNDDSQITHRPAMQLIPAAFTSTEQSIPGILRPTHPPHDSISFRIFTHSETLIKITAAFTDKQAYLPRNLSGKADKDVNSLDKVAAGSSVGRQRRFFSCTLGCSPDRCRNIENRNLWVAALSVSFIYMVSAAQPA
jgi:hypothetical protein